MAESTDAPPPSAEPPAPREASFGEVTAIAFVIVLASLVGVVLAGLAAAVELAGSGALRAATLFGLAGSGAALLLGGAFLVRALGAGAETRSGYEAAPLGARYLRLVLYGLVIAFAVAAASRKEIAVSRLVGTAGLLLALHAAVLIPGPLRSLAPLFRLGDSRPVRLLDLLAGNVLLFVLVLEICLRVVAAVGVLPVWLQARGDAFALKVRAERLGFTPNELGYMDTAWAPAKPAGGVRIAGLGDSFAVAVVPYQHGVYRVLEEKLSARAGDAPVEVCNLGIAGTCPNDYVSVLEREGLALDPDIVLLGLYVGNDIQVCDEVPGPFSRERLFVYQLVHRIPKVIAERKARAGGLVAEESADPYAGYLEDPPREIAARSDFTYYRVARKHLENFLRASTAEKAAHWAATEAYLERFAAVAKADGRDAVIALFPDRIQVDPELRAELLEIMAKKGVTEADLDLDGPQRRIAAWAAERGIAVIDLLPALRAARADGPVHHLRDEHWNIAGNRVAADALAEGLWPLVSARIDAANAGH